MSTLGWVITLVSMSVGLTLVVMWVADVGGPVEPERERCGAVHPLLKTTCVRGVDHEVVDVHRTVTGDIWFDGEDPIRRDCLETKTDWEGNPWRER